MSRSTAIGSGSSLGKTPGIAHVAYILAEGGAAAIVDPGRDTERYLTVLRENGLRLRWILETHRQEDFEMGGAALRDLTGAQIVALDHEFMAHADRPLKDGENLEMVDGLTVRGLHTPGHTAESLSYACLTSAPIDAGRRDVRGGGRQDRRPLPGGVAGRALLHP